VLPFCCDKFVAFVAVSLSDDEKLTGFKKILKSDIKLFNKFKQKNQSQSETDFAI